jgi:hypothetical protein
VHTPPSVELDGTIRVNNFPLSPYILLPDSFGDIYYGETFAAYIAIVNGFAHQIFYQVSLSARLQTSQRVIDLTDSRGDSGKSMTETSVLSKNQCLDAVVVQDLTEHDTHTLRVSVNYKLTPDGEMKTLRKFYRFNVLPPLFLKSSYLEIQNIPYIQCEITNCTKSPINIETVRFFLFVMIFSCVPVTLSIEI